MARHAINVTNKTTLLLSATLNLLHNQWNQLRKAMRYIKPTYQGPISMIVTLKMKSRNFLRFQIDTGAQCNVVPMDLYKKATKDYHLYNITPCKRKITSYGGTSIPIVDKAIIGVWRGDSSCWFDCKIVDQSNISTVLGRKACVGMKIISYLDNDMMKALM